MFALEHGLQRPDIDPHFHRGRDGQEINRVDIPQCLPVGDILNYLTVEEHFPEVSLPLQLVVCLSSQFLGVKAKDGGTVEGLADAVVLLVKLRSRFTAVRFVA